MKYDYFIAGRTRNKDELKKIASTLRSSGKTAHCFVENEYEGDGIKYDPSAGNQEEEMQALEGLEDWQTNHTFREIYENDMEALKDSKEFIIVFPAGFSAHMELGAAYGMGKKCYGIGRPEKAETLYLMMQKIYPTVEEFLKPLRQFS
jgi:hypothetical protein